MYSYVTSELPSVVKATFPQELSEKKATSGHSMGEWAMRARAIVPPVVASGGTLAPPNGPALDVAPRALQAAMARSPSSSRTRPCSRRSPRSRRRQRATPRREQHVARSVKSNFLFILVNEGCCTPAPPVH